MSKPRPTGPVAIVADLAGGEIVKCHAGTFRVTHRTDGHPMPRRAERWAILLNEDLTETGKLMWLAPNTRVLEVVPIHRPNAGGHDVDPLRGQR